MSTLDHFFFIIDNKCKKVLGKQHIILDYNLYLIHYVTFCPVDSRFLNIYFLYKFNSTIFCSSTFTLQRLFKYYENWNWFKWTYHKILIIKQGIFCKLSWNTLERKPYIHSCSLVFNFCICNLISNLWVLWGLNIRYESLSE